jgi:nitronate monooxygenase
MIVAPMLRVSGLELVEASCRSGVIGAFPTANCRSTTELDEWLKHLRSHLDRGGAPFCPNLIMRSKTLGADLDCRHRHGVEIVITSVGSPKPVVAALHEIDAIVLSDVASIQHARSAIAAGADGLVLLSAGAGGQTGWANPFAFVRAVRAFFDGPIVLAGGVSDGTSLRAAQVLGCNLAYMGTRFIATRESAADPSYKAMLVASSMDDIVLTAQFTGLPTSILRPSVVSAGLDPDTLVDPIEPEEARKIYGADGDGPRRWRDIWSAGHSVSGVGDIPTVQQLIDRLHLEYSAASA